MVPTIILDPKSRWSSSGTHVTTAVRPAATKSLPEVGTSTKVISVGPPSIGDILGDDVVQKIVDFASSMLLDILAIASVSRQYGSAVRSSTCRLVPSEPPEAAWMLTERMANNFLQWSHLAVSGYAGPASTAGIEIPDDDALVYHCCRCRSPILRFGDIASNNYHGAWGPAFLVNKLYNAHVERAAYSAAFVTGGYTVSDVACSVCRLMLGKKYVEARDTVNRFKVGKYLLEQTMVFLPGCCSGSRSGNSRQAREQQQLQQQQQPQHLASGAQRLCVRCSVHVQSRTIQAVMLMTDQLQPGASRRLRNTLVKERIFGETGEGYGQDDAIRLITYRLALFCGTLPGGIEAALFSSFFERVATALATARPPELRDDPQHSHGPGIAGHGRRHTCPAGRSSGPLSIPRAGNSSRGAGYPAGHGGSAAAAVGSAAHRGAEVSSIGSSKTDDVGTIARMLRWELAAPAAAASTRDFQCAEKLVKKLKISWQPVWPMEKPGAERLIDLLGKRLSLDREDKDTLLQEMGLKKPSTFFCSWFPCRHGF